MAKEEGIDIGDLEDEATIPLDGSGVWGRRHIRKYRRRHGSSGQNSLLPGDGENPPSDYLRLEPSAKWKA